MATVELNLKNEDIAEIKTSFDACADKVIIMRVEGLNLPITFSYPAQGDGESLQAYGKRILSKMGRCLPKVYKLNLDRTERYVPAVNRIALPEQHISPDIIT